MSRTITIFLADNNKKNNYELMKFLRKNIKTTTSCGNIIVPRIINDEKREQFARDKHIDKVPAIIYQNDKHIGLEQIKEFLRKMCVTKNFTREKSQDELDIDDLTKYQEAIMHSSAEDEDDNAEDDIQDRLSRVAEMAKFRAEQSKTLERNVYGHKSTESIDTTNYKNENEIILSGRDNNINSEETDEDISKMAHDDGGADTRYMDALMEKIGVSNL